MVYRGCTFGMAKGACHVLPAVAVWRHKQTQKQTWVCATHDRVIADNIKRAGVRSKYRRTAFKEPVSA